MFIYVTKLWCSECNRQTSIAKDKHVTSIAKYKHMTCGYADIPLKCMQQTGY